ncbi:hypothetical protein FOCC_FOCC004130 [Frankliniella occidentalis]|nr:hypothetical protein FOCC_FOCC004130 [Frankliniella occidentalis]
MLVVFGPLVEIRSLVLLSELVELEALRAQGFQVTCLGCLPAHFDGVDEPLVRSHERRAHGCDVDVPAEALAVQVVVHASHEA